MNEKIIRENINATIRIIEIDNLTYKLIDDNTDTILFYENRNDAIRKFGILTRTLNI